MRLELCLSLSHPALPEWIPQWIPLARIHASFRRNGMVSHDCRPSSYYGFSPPHDHPTDATASWILADCASCGSPLDFCYLVIFLLEHWVGSICWNYHGYGHRPNLCNRRYCLWFLWGLRSPGKTSNFNCVVCLHNCRRPLRDNRWHHLWLRWLAGCDCVPLHLSRNSSPHALHSTSTEAIVRGGFLRT